MKVLLQKDVTRVWPFRLYLQKSRINRENDQKMAALRHFLVVFTDLLAKFTKEPKSIEKRRSSKAFVRQEANKSLGRSMHHCLEVRWSGITPEFIFLG